MRLIVSILCSLLQILIVPVGFGQRPAARTSSARCPQLVIACPLETVEQATQLRFSALVAGQDPATLSYTWALTGANVGEGNGTHTITVETAGLAGRRITATVAVNGLPRECQSIASCTVYIAGTGGPRRLERKEPHPPVDISEARPVDTHPARSVDTRELRRLESYGDLAFDLERERLSRFAAELRSRPEAQGYIIVYGGPCSGETLAVERAERAKDFLVNRHGIDASRIVAIDGGYRESLATEIYIGPIDAALPLLAASADPPRNARCK